MPKKKSLKTISKKQQFKFNIKKILKERREDQKLSKEKAETDKQNAIDDLFQKEVKCIFDEDIKSPLASSKLDQFIFDGSKYNIPFNENLYPDVSKLCLQRLLIMSIEQNELRCNIHFNHLMNSKWSLELNDVRCTLRNWEIDLDNIYSKPLLRHESTNNLQVGRHNFEFVMTFIIQSILRNNKLSDNDLLTLAKFAVAISFDNHYRQMLNVIKKLFSICIETALHEDNETDIIIFAQELFSKYEEVYLLKMTVDLFLPLEGQIMRKIYTYIAFKLYKSLIGNVDCIIEFPSHNEWFIQDLLDKDYFSQKPKKVFKSVIRLLEHVVVVFDLYKDEAKLNGMQDFFRSIIIKPAGLFKSQNILSILDHWKLQLFRLHVKHKLQ